MPLANHGRVATDTITGHYAAAQQVLDQLGRLGVDYANAVNTLERAVFDKFAASWRELLDTLAAAIDSSVCAPTSRAPVAGAEVVSRDRLRVFPWAMSGRDDTGRLAIPVAGRASGLSGGAGSWLAVIPDICPQNLWHR